MNLRVHLKNQSKGIDYEDVINTYEKGSFYCIYIRSGYVHKYPISDIWRVEEEYIVSPKR